MRDLPARHDGRWLMTPLDPGEQIATIPRTSASSGFSFHLRDTELLVTTFPGCRTTRFFLPIRTCHATQLRTYTATDVRIFSRSFSRSERDPVSRLLCDRFSFGPSPSLSLSLSLSDLARHPFQTTTLNGRRLRLIRQRCTTATSIDRCNREPRQGVSDFSHFSRTSIHRSVLRLAKVKGRFTRAHIAAASAKSASGIPRQYLA